MSNNNKKNPGKKNIETQNQSKQVPIGSVHMIFGNNSPGNGDGKT
jgi:hypothetical protein